MQSSATTPAAPPAVAVADAVARLAVIERSLYRARALPPLSTIDDEEACLYDASHSLRRDIYTGRLSCGCGCPAAAYMCGRCGEAHSDAGELVPDPELRGEWCCAGHLDEQRDDDPNDDVAFARAHAPEVAA